MAKGALTKEIRSIVSKKTGDMRKRMKEASFQDRIASELGGFAGAGLSAFVDGRTTEKKASGEVDKIELGPLKIDTNVVTGAVAAGAGLFIGKGAIGHGLAGSGMTQLKISFYRMVLKKAEESEAESADETEE